MKTSTLIRRFLPYFKKYRGMLFLDLVCAALTTVCDLVLPLIVRDVTDLAANNLSALTVSFVLRVGGIYVLLRIVDALANFYMASRGHIMGTFIERDMRNDLFAHLQTLGFAYYSNAKVGQIMARITSDLFEVTEFAHHCPEEFFIAGIKIVIPFIILMVAIMPFTRMVVGTTIGVKGAIVPLVVSAAPFIARMVETSLNEVDAGVVEAAQSMGASTLQIVWKVYLPEAKPSLILGGAISLVTILAYPAIAGTVGAGGLGDIAVRYGHQRGITSVMWVTVVFLIILVQVVQLIFNWLSRRIDKRLDQPSGAKKSGPLDLLPRFAHTK